MALGKTAKYYKLNPEARKKKAATDKKINSRNGKDSRKGKDYDHATGKYENVKTNRGRKGEGNR
jgi:hypothetical protein